MPLRVEAHELASAALVNEFTAAGAASFLGAASSGLSGSLLPSNSEKARLAAGFEKSKEKAAAKPC
jgi:hypothetical protein